MPNPIVIELRACYEHTGRKRLLQQFIAKGEASFNARQQGAYLFA
jgi:hypothetical protein